MKIDIKRQWAMTRGPAELAPKLVAETLGTATLVMAIIGSGIAAERAFPTDPGLALAINALVTGAILTALIMALFAVSASFNPVVTILQRLHGTTASTEAAWLISAQLLGAMVGAVIANTMFDLTPIAVSSTDRATSGVLLGEATATVGLLIVIAATARTGDPAKVGLAVGAYIMAAIWFTSSTALANPAVTFGRMFTESFTGIAPSSASWFILAQLTGLAVAAGAISLLFPSASTKVDQETL